MTEETSTILLNSRTYRQSSRLYKMLEALSKGQSIQPKRPHECIIFDIDKDPKQIDATFFDNRINGFKNFIEDYFLIATELAGISDSCIRIYLRPDKFDANLKKRVIEDLHPLTVQKAMFRFDIDRAFFYGETLSVKY